MRIEIFDPFISYKVPYRTLTPLPAPSKITDVKRQRVWTIWIDEKGSFISPLLICSGGTSLGLEV